MCWIAHFLVYLDFKLAKLEKNSVGQALWAHFFVTITQAKCHFDARYIVSVALETRCGMAFLSCDDAQTIGFGADTIGFFWDIVVVLNKIVNFVGLNLMSSSTHSSIVMQGESRPYHGIIMITEETQHGTDNK